LSKKEKDKFNRQIQTCPYYDIVFWHEINILTCLFMNNYRITQANQYLTNHFTTQDKHRWTNENKGVFV